MIDLTGELKSHALSFQNRIRNDKELLENIENTQDDN